jgi:pseudouridine kinase
VKIACIGGAHIDRHGVLKGPPIGGTSNPGNVTSDFGGVARNVAENLARLGCEVVMVSRVGHDESGRAVVAHLRGLGVDTSMVSVAARSTASYTAILEASGELVLGLADMDLYEEITPALLQAALPKLRECDLWFVDANLSQETIEWLVPLGAMVAADAISVVKSQRLRGVLDRLALLFLNDAQAAALGGVDDAKSGIMTRGASGITVWSDDVRRTMAAFPAAPRNVTGAGDALIAGTLFGISKGLGLMDAAQLGLAAAAITVESGSTVAQHLTAELLYERLAANRS